MEILHLMFQINELKVMNRGCGGGGRKARKSLVEESDVCFLQKKIPDSATQTH